MNSETKTILILSVIGIILVIGVCLYFFNRLPKKQQKEMQSKGPLVVFLIVITAVLIGIYYLFTTPYKIEVSGWGWIIGIILIAFIAIIKWKKGSSPSKDGVSLKDLVGKLPAIEDIKYFRRLLWNILISVFVVILFFNLWAWVDRFFNGGAVASEEKYNVPPSSHPQAASYQFPVKEDIVNGVNKLKKGKAYNFIRDDRSFSLDLSCDGEAKIGFRQFMETEFEWVSHFKKVNDKTSTRNTVGEPTCLRGWHVLIPDRDVDLIIEW